MDTALRRHFLRFLTFDLRRAEDYHAGRGLRPAGGGAVWWRAYRVGWRGGRR
jgi:hypothetical protein